MLEFAHAALAAPARQAAPRDTVMRPTGDFAALRLAHMPILQTTQAPSASRTRVSRTQAPRICQAA